MVRNKKQKPTSDDQEEIEITTDNTEKEFHDPELEEVEENEKNIISSLREKLKTSDLEKRQLLEDVQRQKADYLNARRRLDEDRARDKERAVIGHVERLIPLCDSFEMAMGNKEVWEKADANWRKGIEGIYAQLQSIIAGYHIKALEPLHEVFDPKRHEALSTTIVTEEKDHDRIMTVIQKGYELQKDNNTTELVRPARVIIGQK